MDIAFEFSRKRKEFGKHPSFTDSGPIELISVEPTTEFKEKWEVRPSTEIAIDCIPSMAEHEINTERYIAIDTGMQHKEGGWPKEINTQEFEDKKRYLRKIEMDDSFNEIVLGLTRKVEHRVKQNNSINMFEEYFVDQTDDHSAEPPTAKTITIFRDPSKKIRPVSRICWHPESSYRIASVHCDLSFESMNISMSSSQIQSDLLDSYIWDITNPNRPYYTIKPVSPICCISFNKKNTDSFVCGSYNGILGVWDLRKSGNKAVESTVIEKTHSDPIYDCEWIQSRTGTEFVSVSTDGVICWWDSRKLSTGPMDQMILCDESERSDDTQSSNTNDSQSRGELRRILYGGTSLEYRTDAGATKYLVGTEQGTIISVERKAKKDGDSQKQIKLIYGESSNVSFATDESKIDESYKHHGPIYSLSRNYFLPKCILSVGDWMARIWTEDIKTPIMSTRYESSYLTSGIWSPTRPGVFYITKQNGELDIWDYYFKGQFEPAYTVKISEQYSLSDVKVSLKSQGKFVGVGCSDGSVTILELGNSLYQSNNLNIEKQAITQLFERETNREKGLQTAKLAQLRAKKQQMKKANNNEKSKPKATNQEQEEKQFDLADFTNIEADFLSFIEKKKPQESNQDERKEREKENSDIAGNQ